MCIMRAEFYERTVAQRYEGYRIIAAFAICIVGSPAFNTLYCLFYNRNDAFLSAPDKLHAALCPLILEEKREGMCARPHEFRARSACGPRAFGYVIKTAESHCYCPRPIVSFFSCVIFLIACNAVDYPCAFFHLRGEASSRDQTINDEKYLRASLRIF